MESKNKLFDSFEFVSSKMWKQHIQYELKGADYNEKLVWESSDGIKVRPFYHFDENITNCNVNTNATNFKILQQIFVFDEQKSNKKALDTLQRGAQSISFTIEKETISIEKLLQNIPFEQVICFFNISFLSIDLVNRLTNFAKKHQANFIIQIDPIHHLLKTGNYFTNLETDLKNFNQLVLATHLPIITIKSGIYQNAGATIVQQLAYTLAHANEYFNQLENYNIPITIEVAIGPNYFFEIAKLRALNLLFNTLAKEYNHNQPCIIVATPSKRNKTIYDYNVNMQRTTTECMSAILGGAQFISNLPYDALYHKDNEFGDRISRNQLLILKNESYLDKVNNPADGSYYIETLTQQLSEKALDLFKDIEKNGGLISQLKAGTIQRKINESAQKEQELFDTGKEVLLGTNKYPNQSDFMKHDLELYPFVKQNGRKTSISPVIEKRLAEKIEQERLKFEE